MPRLLINKKKGSPRSRPARKVTFVLPHSPFQKLVEAARIEHRLSYVELAKLISGKNKKVHPGSIWIWLHSPNGHPHPKSCTAAHLGRMAAILGIPLPRLKESLDASRHLFTQREQPMAIGAVESWQEFVNWLKNDPRKTILKKTVLSMAERFLAASTSTSRSIPANPASK